MTSDLKWFDKRIAEAQRTLRLEENANGYGYASLELQDLIEEREERYRRYLRDDRDALEQYLSEQVEDASEVGVEILTGGLNSASMERGVIIICIDADERAIKHQVDRRIRAIGRRLGVQCDHAQRKIRRRS